MILIRQEGALNTLVGDFTRGMNVSTTALADLEAILSPNEQYDYCSYIKQDSRIITNSSKLLLLSVFLIRLIDQYQ